MKLVNKFYNHDFRMEVGKLTVVLANKVQYSDTVAHYNP